MEKSIPNLAESSYCKTIHLKKNQWKKGSKVFVSTTDARFRYYKQPTNKNNFKAKIQPHTCSLRTLNEFPCNNVDASTGDATVDSLNTTLRCKQQLIDASTGDATVDSLNTTFRCKQQLTGASTGETTLNSLNAAL